MIGPVLVAMIAAWLMIQSGVGKNLLQWRRRPYCPSCGRNASDCRCRVKKD
jgi:hypothetical protein